MDNNTRQIHQVFEYTDKTKKKQIKGRGSNLENIVFGKITVLELVGFTKHGKRVWKCKCECGKIKNIQGTSLVTGRTSTCGGYAHRSTTLPWGEAAFNGLYRVYQNQSAKKRGLIFELTKDQFRYITKQNCYYCKSEPKSETQLGRKYGSYTYNGIDRKDNTIGYTLENSLPCCRTCNIIKMDAPYDIFLLHIEKIYKNLIEKK